MRNRTPMRLLAVPLAAVFLVSLSACAALGSMLAGQPQPKIEVDKVSLKTATMKEIKIQTDFTVENPYAVSLPVMGFEYEVWIAEVPLAKGSVKFDQPIPARGKAPLTTTLSFGPADAVRAVVKVTGGDRRYRIAGTFKVRTPIGEMSVRVSKSGTFSPKSLFKLPVPGFGVTPPPPRRLPDA